MKFTIENLSYYDMLTLWSYCRTVVNNLREISPETPVYKFLQNEADKLERIAEAIDKSIQRADREL